MALSCSRCCRRDTFLPPGGRETLCGPCGNVPAKGCHCRATHLGTGKSIESHTALPCRRTINGVHCPSYIPALETPLGDPGPHNQQFVWAESKELGAAIGKVCAPAAVPPKLASAHRDQLLDETEPVEHQEGKDPGVSVLDQSECLIQCPVSHNLHLLRNIESLGAFPSLESMG